MKRIIISVVLLFVIAALFIISVNGIAPHPYAETELEGVFLEKAEENGLSLEDGYEIVEKKHANSMTYLMEDVNGKHAWETFVMTPLNGKYKSYDFYTDQMNLVEGSPYTYMVNDGIMKYDLTVTFDGNLLIEGTEKAQSVLSLKMLTMSFGIMVIIANLLLNRVRKGKFD